MKLYNTMSHQIEEIVPYAAPKLGLYACGFTVYDYTHLGHLRKYSMDDVLVRTLKHVGFRVNHVQNVTDVGHLASDEDTGEDKLEKGAKKYHQTVYDIAKKFEDYFFYSMDLMGNLRPTVICRATEHVQEQLELVKKLEAKGFTYVVEGDGVYFDTSKLADYGKLANLDLEKLREGARVAKVNGKRNPTDFALWKFERPGENRAMVWPSPWHERSFPGWHIECSAMSMKYLGEQFEIHTGGIDHIPVHHTNEIAQAETATGKKPFVKYWVHHNFLQVEGEKMSKSLGNFYTIDDVLKRGFSPQALRLLFFGAHYRSELNFTWKNLEGAQKAWQRLVKQLGELKSMVKNRQVENLSHRAEQLKQQFFLAMENDLNTAEAMAILWQVFKVDLTSEEKLTLLFDFDQVLGFGLANLPSSDQQSSIVEQDLPADIQQSLAERLAAREARDWQKSDALRDQLASKGYLVTDKQGKQLVRKIDK